MNFTNGMLTLSLPEIDWSAITWQQYLLVWMSISAVYGLITHYHSLPGIRRHNKNVSVRYQLNEGKLAVLFFGRLIFALSWRVFVLVLGIVVFFSVIIMAGKIRTEELKEAWQWHQSPQELLKIWVTD